MERKLIKQGGGGLTIYLPKKWIDSKGLKSGDYVNLRQTDTRIVIGSEVKKIKEASVTINNENAVDTRHILTHIYRKGFNKIIIKTDLKEVVREVKKTVRDVMFGFEFTSIKDNEFVIENISDLSEEKYDDMLKKVFFIIKETQKFVKKKFLSKRINNFSEMQELRDQADKFILFCRRLISKDKFEGNSLLEWEMLTFLMHIQHGYYYLYEYVSGNKVKINKYVVESLEGLEDYFDIYEKAYYEKNINQIHKINNMKKRHHFGRILKLIETSDKKNSVVFSYIREIFRIIQIGTSPIFSMIFND